jgi:hypothetical protein
MDPYPSLPPPPPGADPERPEPEATPPGASDGSPARIALVIGALVSVLVGVVLIGRAWFGEPEVCWGSSIESARFGYCLEAPGWDFTNEQTSHALPYDELVDADRGSSLRIQATDDARALDAVLSDVRAAEQARTGVVLGDVRDTSVAGVPARQWDVTLERRGVEVQVREVVFVRDGTAWLVRLIADPEGFAVGAQELDRILGSWIFR